MTLPADTRLPQVGDRLDVTVEGSDLIQSSTVIAIDDETITLRMDASGAEHELPLERCLDLVWYSDVSKA